MIDPMDPWRYVPRIEHHHVVDVHIHNDEDPRLERLLELTKAIDRRTRKLMAGQEDIDAAVAALGIDNARLIAASQRIQSELDALASAGVDTSALVAALGELDAATGTVENVGAVAPPVDETPVDQPPADPNA